MTEAISQLDPKQLVTLLRQQRDLYVKLRDLSGKQRTMIAGDRPELLLSILRDRQDLVTSLARLNDKLAPFRRHWDAMYAALPENDRTLASSLLQEINGLLRAILRADQEDGALLSARKQGVAEGIQTLSGGQVANTAYARQAGPRKGSTAADVTG